MRKLPDRIYVFWSENLDSSYLTATSNYGECVADPDDHQKVVGVYDFAHCQVVEKNITLSTRKVSRTGKLGRIP